MRLRPTHSVSVSAEVKTGTDELGSPLHNQRPVLESPARYHSAEGQSFTRTASGELVQEQPTVMLPIHATAADGYGDEYGEWDGNGQLLTHEHVEEGAEVTLSGLAGADDWTVPDATFAVDSIDIKRARGGRPEAIELTLQRNP